MAPSLAAPLLTLLLSLALAASVVTDLRSRLILDVVTWPTIALALAARLALGGWGGPWGLASGLLGLALGLLTLLPLAWKGAMGMGDVKLLGAVGAAVGWRDLPEVLLHVALAGGILALVAMLRAGVVRRTLLRAVRLLLPGRAPGPEEAPLLLPYGLAIAAGTASALLLGKGGWG